MNCDYCKNEVKETISMPFVCRRCGGSFCSKHRLPENHDCSKLHPLIINLTEFDEQTIETPMEENKNYDHPFLDENIESIKNNEDSDIQDNHLNTNSDLDDVKILSENENTINSIYCEYCDLEIELGIKTKPERNKPFKSKTISGGNFDFVTRNPIQLPFKCRRCGGSFCSKHRLPENHICIIKKKSNLDNSLLKFIKNVIISLNSIFKKIFHITKEFCMNIFGLICTILFILFLIYGFSLFSVTFDILDVGLNQSRIIGGSEDERILIQNSLDKMPWHINYRILSIRVINSQSKINEICHDEFYNEFDIVCPDCYVAGCAETWTSFAPSRIYLLSLNENPITEHTIYHEIGHIAKGTSELKANEFAEQYLN